MAASMGHPHAISALGALAQDPQETVRYIAVKALEDAVQDGKPGAVAALMPFLDDANSYVRCKASEVLRAAERRRILKLTSHGRIGKPVTERASAIREEEKTEEKTEEKGEEVDEELAAAINDAGAVASDAGMLTGGLTSGAGGGLLSGAAAAAGGAAGGLWSGAAAVAIGATVAIAAGGKWFGSAVPLRHGSGGFNDISGLSPQPALAQVKSSLDVFEEQDDSGGGRVASSGPDSGSSLGVGPMALAGGLLGGAAAVEGRQDDY